MAVREILRMGDSCLLERAVPIDDFEAPELGELIRDMFDTMTATGGVGLRGEPPKG